MSRKKHSRKRKKRKKKLYGEGNLFDKILHENSDSSVFPLAAKLLGLKVLRHKYVKTKMQFTSERETDGCYLVETEENGQLLLHLEYQSSNDSKLIYRINLYVALIRFFHPGYPIKSVVVYVGNEPVSMRTKLHDYEIFKGFDLIVAKEDLDSEELLKSEEPTEVLTAILGNYKPENAEELLYKIIARLRETCESQADLIKCCNQLLVISFLRNLGELTLKILKAMPVHIDIAKTSVFEEAFMPTKLEYERLINEEKKARAIERAQAQSEKEAIQKTSIVNLLRYGAGLSVAQIAEISKVSLSYVLAVKEEMGM